MTFEWIIIIVLYCAGSVLTFAFLNLIEEVDGYRSHILRRLSASIFWLFLFAYFFVSLWFDGIRRLWRS